MTAVFGRMISSLREVEFHFFGKKTKAKNKYTYVHILCLNTIRFKAQSLWGSVKLITNEYISGVMKTVLKNCNRALSWCFYLASPKVTTYKEGQSFFSFFTRLSIFFILSLVFARLHGLEAARKLGEIKVK